MKFIVIGHVKPTVMQPEMNGDRAGKIGSSRVFKTQQIVGESA